MQATLLTETSNFLKKLKSQLLFFKNMNLVKNKSFAYLTACVGIIVLDYSLLLRIN